MNPTEDKFSNPIAPQRATTPEDGLPQMVEDRVIKHVKQPPRTPLDPQLMYPDPSKWREDLIVMRRELDCA
jgi:hypothetical protein